MASLRPALDRLDQLVVPLNESENAVLHALAKLDDEWTVYVQPRLGQDQPDFLAVHPHAGVCVIEVKDWRPGGVRSDENGTVQVLGADGAWARPPTQPRFEASRLRSNVYDQYFAMPSDGTQVNETVRSVVILPRFSDEDAGRLLAAVPSMREAERKIAVWGGDGLVHRLAQIIRGAGCAHPLPASIERLHQHVTPCERVLDPTGVPPLSAGARLIADNPTGSTVRRVRGPAGSGKSMGVAARAARLAAQGKKVLVLSFNVTLANHLLQMVVQRSRSDGANPTLVTCTNFHSFCTRVVQDGEQVGVQTSSPRNAMWTTSIVIKATQVFEAGHGILYDAVLVDEGQDFTVEWWNLLRDHAVVPGGELLLVSDSTQDIYDREAWADPAVTTEAVFTEPWIELTGSYRTPNDLLQLVDEFAAAHLGDERLSGQVLADQAEVVGRRAGSVRRWRTVARVGDLGREVGLEVVRLLRENPTLQPRDVAFLCEYHHDGVAAVAEIEAAGYHVHHIFSRNPDDARRRRKYRFWPNADGVKGCTVHSFKGWSTPALVMGIGVETRSKHLAYVAMTRVQPPANGHPAFLSVINADKRIADFVDTFEREIAVDAVPVSPVPVPAAAVATAPHAATMAAPARLAGPAPGPMSAPTAVPMAALPSLAPLSVAPPTLAPPSTAPPSTAPPSTAPASMAPPSMTPPSMTPASMGPPSMTPPTLAPASMAPASMTPPSMTPPSMTPPVLATPAADPAFLPAQGHGPATADYRAEPMAGPEAKRPQFASMHDGPLRASVPVPSPGVLPPAPPTFQPAAAEQPHAAIEPSATVPMTAPSITPPAAVPARPTEVFAPPKPAPSWNPPPTI